MTVALVSDIHGNLPALEAVLDDAARHGASQTVCLGDIVDLGPHPAESVALLRQVGARCLVGNHDPLDEAPGSPVLDAVLEFTRDALSAADRAELAALPARVEVDLGDGWRMLCVHGSPRSFHDQILDSTPEAALAGMLRGVDHPVVACGHTHLQLLRMRGTQRIVNVGSVGMPFLEPFDGRPPCPLPWAEYGLVSLEGGVLEVRLRRVPYDFDAFSAAVRRRMPYGEQWIAQWARR